MQEIHCLSSQIVKMLCPNNHQTQLLCSSKFCKNQAFVCRFHDCQCLNQYHYKCQLINAKPFIKEIQAKKGKLTPQVQEAIKKIDEIYEKSIEQLSKDRDLLRVWTQNFGLSQNQLALFEYIQSHEKSKVTGELIANIRQNIEEQNDFSFLNSKWVDQLWDKQKKVIDKFLSSLRVFTRGQSSKWVQFDKKITYKPHFGYQWSRYFQHDSVSMSFEKISTSTYVQLVGQQKLPQTGKCRIDLLVQKGQTGQIGIGIITDNARHYKCSYDNKQSIKYFTNGDFYMNGAVQRNYPKIGKGQIISLCLDQQKHSVMWINNGKILKNIMLPQKFIDKSIYISIEAGDIGTKFKIL